LDLVVVKIGGSLLRLPGGLRAFCKELPSVKKLTKFIIVPGGGVFADDVRKLYNKLNLSDSIAHFTAIIAMDMYGLILSDLIPHSKPVMSLYEAKNELKRNIIPIVLPSHIMMSVDVLKHSWEVTSDSISAYIAHLLGAQKLVLVKDVDALYSSNPKVDKNATIIESIKASQLACLNTSTCTDKMLPKLLIDYSLECIIVGPNVKNLIKALKGGKFKGTRVIPR